MYALTETGKEKTIQFIEECKALRKEILDGKKDTASETIIPTLEDIESDIANFVDDADDYYNGWGVTDNYDLIICLEYAKDFKKKLLTNKTQYDIVHT